MNAGVASYSFANSRRCPWTSNGHAIAAVHPDFRSSSSKCKSIGGQTEKIESTESKDREMYRPASGRVDRE